MRPNFDRMEARLALSGAGIGLLATQPSTTSQVATDPMEAPPIVRADPAPGSIVAGSPSTLSVQFARAIDPLSIGFADFALERIAVDGSASPLSPREASFFERIDPVDPSGTRILLDLSRPLAEGRYRLELRGSSAIRSGGSGLVGPSSDVEVSSFTVEQARGGLSSAIDLGVASSTVVGRSDTLDFSADAGAMKLYKLTVPEGHYWRLGLAISAQRDGGTLGSVLALFDAQGRPLSVATQGRPDVPGDPYLFAGVTPGTYYVGVSGQGNVPGQVGGYDPAAGVAGVSGLKQAGGPFRLQFVADPADQPTRVTGIRVDRSDPYSKAPTGLTLQFSGAIRESDLSNPDQSSLSLVDESGQAWKVKVIRYDESKARLSVAFDRALPAGLYQIRVAPGGGLVDLAGKTPAAPGEPEGVLGALVIDPSIAAPDDLGAVLPGLGSAGVRSTVSVAPGRAVVEHFDVVESGYYEIGGPIVSPGLSIGLTGPSGDRVDFQPTGGPGSRGVFLRPGVYSIGLSNDGPQVVSGEIQVRELLAEHDSLLVGGTAQGAALDLRLVTPTASIEPTAAAGPNSFEGVVPAGLSVASSGPVAATGDGGGAASHGVTPASSGAYVFLGVGPVGRPALASEQISVVGPSGFSDSVALASSHEGLPPGLIANSPRASRSRRVGREAPQVGVPPAEVADSPELAGPATDLGLVEGAGSPAPDEAILAEADWIGRVVDSSLGRLKGLFAGALPSGEAAGPPGDLVGVSDAKGGHSEEPNVQVASIAPTVGFGVLAMVAFRKWHRLLSPAKPRLSAPASRPRPLLSGPHTNKKIRIHR